MTSGTFAYVVLSHQQPDLVARAVAALRRASPAAHIVLRHDARNAPLPPLQPSPRLHLRPSTAEVQWGHWSLVEAMLVELRFVRAELHCSHIVFVSGSDYPTQQLQRWEAEVSSADAVLHARPLHFRPRFLNRRGFDGDDDMIRYLYAWYGIPGTSRGRRPRSDGGIRALNRVFDQIRPLACWRLLPHGRGTMVGIRRRKTPFSSTYRCYKGWQWLVLSARAADAVLSECGSARGLARYYRRTLIPDESFIQTVICNHPGLQVRHSAISFTDWSGSVEHPRVLDLSAWERIKSSGLPFARKMDRETSRELMDRLDEEIAS